MSYDVIVVGVGGMGSAALWQLARRGKRVLGLARWGIPHAHGSSHGVSRIIGLPYYESCKYVSSVRRMSDAEDQKLLRAVAGWSNTADEHFIVDHHTRHDNLFRVDRLVH